jgi:hypothetical protein
MRWLVARLLRRASRLRFPTLFGLVAVLFVVTLVVPDAIPLADEVLLGLGALALGSWRRRDDVGAKALPAAGAPTGRRS